MFHPVGSRPPSVYWRRRALLVVAVLVLLLVLLTVHGFGSGRASTAAATRSPGNAGATTGATGAVSATATAGDSSGARRPSATARSRASRHRRVASGRTSPSQSAPTARCNVEALRLIAAVDKPTYPFGAHPLVQLQVTNTGARPCVQDLADRQVELRIYNGASPVWGSHDCTIDPRSSDQLLTPSVPVRVAIPWSGLTSRPGCRGVRQRVGPGAYTVYATLAGRTGRAAQFSIS